MRKAKAIITFLVLVLMLVPKIGFAEGSEWWRYLVYSFFHASIVHLGFNLYGLWIIHIERYSDLLVAFMIAGIVAPLCCMSIPTVGLSGLIFALYGIRLMSIRKRIERSIWLIALLTISTGIAIPNVNWKLHLLCFISGCICNFFIGKWDEYREFVKG